MAWRRPTNVSLQANTVYRYGVSHYSWYRVSGRVRYGLITQSGLMFTAGAKYQLKLLSRFTVSQSSGDARPLSKLTLKMNLCDSEVVSGKPVCKREKPPLATCQLTLLIFATGTGHWLVTQVIQCKVKHPSLSDLSVCSLSLMLQSSLT